MYYKAAIVVCTYLLTIIIDKCMMTSPSLLHVHTTMTMMSSCPLVIGNRLSACLIIENSFKFESMNIGIAIINVRFSSADPGSICGSCSTSVAISVIVSSVVSLIAGAVIGAVMHYCAVKKKCQKFYSLTIARKQQKQQPAPLYEDIVAQKRTVEPSHIELRENIAYGPLQD